MYHENATVDALMKRGYLYLEDHDWKNAKGYFDDSLDVDPENAQAYIGMLLSELHIEREEEITKSDVSFADNYYYQKALRFAKDSYKQKVEDYIREKYTVSDELAILRQRDTKPEEYAEYYAYCEECKAKSK